MSIVIPRELETRLRNQAELEGLSVEEYLERLINSVERAEDDIAALAREGLNSGALIEVDARYWEEKHRRLDERLKKS